MIRCAALGCGNDEDSGVSLFPFPKKPKLKRMWEANIGRSDLAATAAVCEQHFADKDLALKNGTKFMKADAVPTMFGCQNHLGYPIRRSNRTKQSSKRDFKGSLKTQPTEKHVGEATTEPEKGKEKPNHEETQVDDENAAPLSETPKRRGRRKKAGKVTATTALDKGEEDNPRKVRLVLDGADERGHAIAEWYLLDIFEATRSITTHLRSGTLITDNLVANVEETIIEVISKLLQRISSVIITSIEDECGIRSDIKKILGKIDGEVADAVHLLLNDDKEELNQPKIVQDGDYEQVINHLDPKPKQVVLEEVISPPTEDSQVLMEHSYFKDFEDEQDEGKQKNEKSDQPLQCGFCGFKSYWKSKLRKHLSQKHLGGERLYSCPECDYKVQSKEGLHKHFRTHTGSKPHACSICDFRTANKSNLSRHMLRHTGEKPFQCDHCLKLFRQKVSLAAHIKTHRKDMTGKPDDRNVYACGDCGFVTVSRREWLEHSKTHKVFRCAHCEFVSGEYPELKKHQMVHRGISHSCSICKRRCRNADELRIHLETHSSGSDLVCNICGYRATQQSYLNRHFKVHFAEKTHKCDYCFMKFRSSGHLNAHVRRHEIGPYCKR